MFGLWSGIWYVYKCLWVILRGSLLFSENDASEFQKGMKWKQSWFSAVIWPSTTNQCAWRLPATGLLSNGGFEQDFFVEEGFESRTELSSTKKKNIQKAEADYELCVSGVWYSIAEGEGRFEANRLKYVLGIVGNGWLRVLKYLTDWRSSKVQHAIMLSTHPLRSVGFESVSELHMVIIIGESVWVRGLHCIVHENLIRKVCEWDHGLRQKRKYDRSEEDASF